MRPIEFEIQRTIRAPIDEVFARLLDIEGTTTGWLVPAACSSTPGRPRPGKPTVGTTCVDETSQGTMPGEIAEMERPHMIVFHWWEKSKSGKLKFEGWPSYHLQPSGDTQTLSAIAAPWSRTACGASAHRSGGLGDVVCRRAHRAPGLLARDLDWEVHWLP